MIGMSGRPKEAKELMSLAMNGRPEMSEFTLGNDVLNFETEDNNENAENVRPTENVKEKSAVDVKKKKLDDSLSGEKSVHVSGRASEIQ